MERWNLTTGNYARWLKAGAVSAVVMLVFVETPGTHPLYSATTAKPASCTAPENRQFDFWIGDWNAFDVDHPATITARTRVDLVLDGCVLWEQYEGTTGSKGQSFSIYDASRGVWHQSWVTNRGQLLVIEGKMQAGEMVLSGVDHTAGGKERRVRGTWKAVNGGVRETAVTSTDGGKTWNLWFDILFRRYARGPTPIRPTGARS